LKLNRQDIADLIYKRLKEEQEVITKSYQNSMMEIGYFFVDNLLPEELVHKIHKSFPKLDETVLKKSMREYKHVAVQMNNYSPILEEAVYAFQDQRIVDFFKEVCGQDSIFPDKNLYAGGLSMMAENNFLNPHLDNSHDKDRNLWRVFNLLYYVTPEWQRENGGNLEIWPNGLNQEQITIDSKFNRLVVMATHNRSWHSVSKVRIDRARCCISNYYFSEQPLFESDSFHVTSFRGRPKQRVTDFILQIDSSFRMALRKVFKKGIRENPHVYKKEDK